MDIKNDLNISFRPIQKTDEDLEFLYQLYATTREEEMKLTGWDPQEAENFLRMQFKLQHNQYMTNYSAPSFEIILVDNIPAGRLYLNRLIDEIRVIDISLLPQFRRKGIGSRILNSLVDEAHQRKIAISLHVEVNNPALKLYEKLGFEREKQAGIYYFMVKQP